MRAAPRSRGSGAGFFSRPAAPCQPLGVGPSCSVVAHLAPGRRLLAAALALVAVRAGPAEAEDEVRIVLADGADAAVVKGTGLTLFDGRDGRRLWAFSGRGTATVRRVGGELSASGPSRIYAKAPILIAEATDAVEVFGGVYYGRLELKPSEDGLIVLNRLPIETYLLGIVGSEMPASWPIEALKAQAVAARTFALQRLMMARAANQRYDLSATVLSQVYKGAERIEASVIEAVRSTRGEVLAHDRHLVEALFHSTCGGRTVASADYFGGSRPYLVERSCTWCRGSNRYRWEVTLKRSEVERRLTEAGLVRGSLSGVLRSSADAPLYVQDGRGRTKVDPRRFRRALGWNGLYSERFSVSTTKEMIEFSGQGFGHGVGLCQWGAKGLAEAGRTHREILLHYYSGAELRRIY